MTALFVIRFAPGRRALHMSTKAMYKQGSGGEGAVWVWAHGPQINYYATQELSVGPWALNVITVTLQSFAVTENLNFEG